MSQPDIERRAYKVDLRAAEPAEGEDKKPGTIEGYAAVFNTPTEDVGFREIILPGAFDRALREGHDVRALWNHNDDIVLGRTKSGTLRLVVDERGLKIENDLPDTQAGRDAMVLIKRGDVNQMSFAFRTLSDNWRSEDGAMVRELIDLELVDVSPVAYPAYSATVVSARALEMSKRSAEPPPAEPEPTPEPEAAGVPNSINEARLKLAVQ